MAKEEPWLIPPTEEERRLMELREKIDLDRKRYWALKGGKDEKK